MRGVTFAAWRGGTYLGLAGVLEALGAHVDGLIWRLAVEEALGPHTEVLESRDAATMTTAELIALTGPDSQVIDGEFVGFREDSSGAAVMIVRAVDSTSWDVCSDDDLVLDAVRREYPDALPIPE
jgi:hypothetical protein